MNSKVNFPFHLRFQSWHVQIIYVGEINAKIIEKDLVNTLKIWVHFQFLLYATIVLKINDLGYSSFFSPMYMDIVWCKIRVFLCELVQAWLEQEAHLLHSGGHFFRPTAKQYWHIQEELSYHGGKTRLMSFSGSINKTKFLLLLKCLY